METITSIDQKRLTYLEDVIQVGKETFVRVGLALAEIRDARLYRASHTTFEDYCRERWGWSKTHSNRLIGAGTVVANLTPTGVILPENESQARPLVTLDPDQQRVAWEVVKKTAPNGKVTAGHVKAVVNLLNTLIETGTVDGENTLTAALTEEAHERLQRQRERLKPRQYVYKDIPVDTTLNESGLGLIFVIPIPNSDDLPSNVTFRASIWIEDEPDAPKT